MLALSNPLASMQTANTASLPALPFQTHCERFDTGRFGLILLCLAFLAGMTYFLISATFADEWSADMRSYAYCGNHEGEALDPIISKERQLGYSANALLWPGIFALALLAEAFLSRDDADFGKTAMRPMEIGRR